MKRTYTHPDVFAAIAAGESWADPVTDPTLIDWTARRAAAAIPFEVVDGRPVNPYAPTGIRYGRGELGHWGEAQAADALVTAKDTHGRRWIVMVERGDGHGWALPGGHVDPGEDPIDAAVRELAEETGLEVFPAQEPYFVYPARYVPDPRATDEAWMVTTLVRFDIGDWFDIFPEVVGADDAKRAAWVLAESNTGLVEHLTDFYAGRIFAAHRDMLRDALEVTR